PLGFMSKIRGERWFCSSIHHQMYRQECELLAMENLARNRAAKLQTQPRNRVFRVNRSAVSGLAGLAPMHRGSIRWCDTVKAHAQEGSPIIRSSVAPRVPAIPEPGFTGLASPVPQLTAPVFGMEQP